MVLGELLGPTNLFEAQAFHIDKATKIVVIYENKQFVFVAFKIMMSCFEGFDNSHKLAIVSLVSSFCSNHFFQKKYYQMPLAQIGLSDYPMGIVPKVS